MRHKKSSKSILKSTGLIGVSQVINIFINLIRSKVVAVFLGPTGTGLIGALQSSVAMIKEIVSLGLNQATVRDIAQANAKKDFLEISSVVITQRRIILLTAFIGLLITFLMAKFLSVFTFKTVEYSDEIRLLSLSVFFMILSGGYGALLQGLRRIKDLAIMSVIGALFSTIIAVPLIYYLRMDGIVFFLVMASFGQFGVAFYYALKVKIPSKKQRWVETWTRSKSMLKLGLGFMGGSLATLMTAYLIRVIIIRNIDISAAGIYQSAMAISGLYINIVLQAMGKDFYPRLAAVAFQPENEIRIINEQTEIGMILSAPGLLFTLAWAPVAIKIIYTSEYIFAYHILQWMILGIFMRTIVWPMGYLFIARGKSIYFFSIQVLANVIHLILIVWLINKVGLIGTGIAFFLLYVLHTSYLYYFVKRENNFKWEISVIRNITFNSFIFIISFVILIKTSKWTSVFIVSSLGILLSYFAIKKVMEVLEVKNYTDFLSLVKLKIKGK